MMQRIWPWMMAAGIICGLATGADGAADVLMTSGDSAVQLTITLVGAMTLWGGLMEILAMTGDVRRVGSLLRRLLSRLFGGIQEDECWEAIGMNLAANFLGLGNAATPSGVRAAQLLSGRGKEGIRALAMLLTLNNAGIQLLPVTVMTLRRAAGSVHLGDIWLPGIAASCTSAAVGAVVLMALQRRKE